MKKTMTKIGTTPLLARLREISKPIDHVPPGFKTGAEWGREWKMHPLVATRLLHKGVAAGVITRKSFRLRLQDGRSYPVPHYAEKRGE
jgi:hypothetical protein